MVWWWRVARPVARAPVAPPARNADLRRLLIRCRPGGTSPGLSSFEGLLPLLGNARPAGACQPQGRHRLQRLSLLRPCRPSTTPGSGWRPKQRTRRIQVAVDDRGVEHHDEIATTAWEGVAPDATGTPAPETAAGHAAASVGAVGRDGSTMRDPAAPALRLLAMTATLEHGLRDGNDGCCTLPPSFPVPEYRDVKRATPKPAMPVASADSQPSSVGRIGGATEYQFLTPPSTARLDRDVPCDDDDVAASAHRSSSLSGRIKTFASEC